MIIGKDYCDKDTGFVLRELGYNPYIFYDDGAPAIHLWYAQKFLREEKDIHVEVYACAGGYIYELCKAYKPNSFSGGTTIYTPNDVDNPKLNDAGRYDDFETCLSDGIKEAILILKDK